MDEAEKAAGDAFGVIGGSGLGGIVLGGVLSYPQKCYVEVFGELREIDPSASSTNRNCYNILNWPAWADYGETAAVGSVLLGLLVAAIVGLGYLLRSELQARHRRQG